MSLIPVVPGFHPDPSICRVGDTYWMVCSSFQYNPGVPLFRSTDLLSWEQVGHILDRPAALDTTTSVGEDGISAPTLRYHDGEFWLITTNFSDGGGMLITRAADPLGQWSEPVRVPGLPGIDPDLAWDEQGTLLVSYAGFGPEGPLGVIQQAVDPETGRVLSEMRPVWQGLGGKFPEGPHLYEIDGFWYVLIAEGGTERGHAVTIARGASPQGPFEPSPWNPLLTHRGSDSPVQNTGHADLVQRPDGSWAMVFHGVRVRGASPEWHVLGRETFAVNIEWENGWPRVGDWLTPPSEPLVVNELDDQTLPVTWVSPRVFPSTLLTREASGWRLKSLDQEPTSDNIAFVGRRQEHLSVSCRATINASQGTGGLSVRIDSFHHVDLAIEGRTVRAIAQIGTVRATIGELAVQGSEIHLEMRMIPAEGGFTSSTRGPDQILAGVVDEDGAFQEIARLDGRYVSTEVAGGMTGRLIGVWCSTGTLGVTSFRYAGADDVDLLPA